MRTNRMSAASVAAAAVCLAALAAGDAAALDRTGMKEGACRRGSGVALEAIETLKGSLSGFEEPTTAVAREIVGIARECPTTVVRTAAAAALGRGIGDNDHPTLEVAAAMATLCGADEPCAVAAVVSLGKGISAYAMPTIGVAAVIADIVRAAPYPAVKEEAVAVLRKGLGPWTHPTQEVAEVIRQVGDCGSVGCPAAPSAASSRDPRYAADHAAVAALAERLAKPDGGVFDGAGRTGTR